MRIQTKLIHCTIIAFGMLLLAGCAGIQQPFTGVPQAPLADTSYTTLAFKQIINPAFTPDVKGKWVHTTVRFAGVVISVSGLPAEYQEGWVRLYFTDIEDLGAFTQLAAIPKEKSDPVFELERGEIIEVKAYLQPITTSYRLSGRTEESVLFRVESLEKSQVTD